MIKIPKRQLLFPSSRNSSSIPNFFAKTVSFSFHGCWLQNSLQNAQEKQKYYIHDSYQLNHNSSFPTQLLSGLFIALA